MIVDALHRLLPASVSSVPDIRHLTADNVLSAMQAEGVEFTINRLGFTSLGDWELETIAFTDDEIYEIIDMEDAGHQGRVLMCTEACTRYGIEQFSCDATDLKEYITNFDIESFFDGDVLVLSEESRTLTVYHHVGSYVHAKL